MRGLTIIMAEASPTRFRSALTLALAQTALGGTARLFLDGGAVALARLPIRGPDDDAHAVAGLPTLPALLEEALDAGLRLILCQSGLALSGTQSGDHHPRAEFGGMIGLLAQTGEDRLIFA